MLSAVCICLAQAPALGIAPEDVEEGSDLEKLLDSEGKLLRIEVKPEAKPVVSGALPPKDDQEAEEASPLAKGKPSADHTRHLQTTLDCHMRPGPAYGYANSPFPLGLNLDAPMPGLKMGGVAQPAFAQQEAKRGCHRTANSENTTPQQPFDATAAKKAIAPARAAKPAPMKKRAARADAKPAVTAPAKKPKAQPEHPSASPATVSKYLGKTVRIPREWFPDDPVPASGYWLAMVDRFADYKKTVWLQIDGEDEFWRYVTELETLELHV